MSHKKFGADRFSRFDVYWIQTNKQTNTNTSRQTDRQAKFIYRLLYRKPNQINFIQEKKSFLNFRMQVVTFVFEGNADVVI